MSPLPNPDRSRSAPPPPPLSLYPVELARNLRVESVSRLDPTPPHAVEDMVPVSAAVEMMRREKVGCVLVTRAGKLVGLFTDRDLLTKVLATGLPLSAPMAECLTPNPVCVHPKDPVQAALKKMEKGGYRHLPVIDDEHRPVGILSVRRVMHYLVEHFPALVYNHPPDPHRYPDAPEGA
ncbi:MAG: CBS domain-containing protein [Gemmataceae bacterium]